MKRYVVEILQDAESPASGGTKVYTDLEEAKEQARRFARVSRVLCAVCEVQSTFQVSVSETVEEPA